MQTDPIPKVIIDSDYTTLGDDGQLGAMACQLEAEGTIELLGITVVSGNHWLRQGVADALKSVERLGMAARVGVYAGANLPLSRDLATIQKERQHYPGGDGYLGAWASAEPESDRDLIAPPDGFAVYANVQSRSAVDFIVDSVRQYPGQVTILAVGPLTNLALAARQHPQIASLIRQIIYMGGAIDVPGNTTATAEFNWWFDPQAAQEVLRLPTRHVVIPLDATDTVMMDKRVYDRVAHDPNKQTIVTRLFRQLNGYVSDGNDGFEINPDYTTSIWDTLTLAYLVDPTFATETVQRWIDVDSSFGADDGRSIGYREPRPGLQRATVVKRFDNSRFYDFYVDLLTRPVPVKEA
jgi:purine nucleosidase